MKPRYIKIWPPPLVQGAIDTFINIQELVSVARPLKKENK